MRIVSGPGLKGGPDQDTVVHEHALAWALARSPSVSTLRCAPGNAGISADGRLVTCLFSTTGTDLKPLLRGDASDEAISERLREIWEARADRYSEQRLAALGSEAGYDPGARSKIEMISLGG